MDPKQTMDRYIDKIKEAYLMKDYNTCIELVSQIKVSFFDLIRFHLGFLLYGSNLRKSIVDMSLWVSKFTRMFLRCVGQVSSAVKIYTL